MKIKLSMYGKEEENLIRVEATLNEEHARRIINLLFSMDVEMGHTPEFTLSNVGKSDE